MKKIILPTTLAIIFAVLIAFPSCTLLDEYREYKAIMNDTYASTEESTTTEEVSQSDDTIIVLETTTEESNVSKPSVKDGIRDTISKIFGHHTKNETNFSEPTTKFATNVSFKPFEPSTKSEVDFSSSDDDDSVNETTSTTMAIDENGFGEPLANNLYFLQINDSSGKLTYLTNGLSFSRILSNWKNPVVLGIVSMDRGNSVIVVKSNNDEDSYWTIDAGKDYLECFKVSLSKTFFSSYGNKFVFEENEVYLYSKDDVVLYEKVLPDEAVVLGTINNFYSINHNHSGKYLLKVEDEFFVLTEGENADIVLLHLA